MNEIYFYEGEVNQAGLQHGYGRLWPWHGSALLKLEGEFVNGHIEGNVTIYEYVFAAVATQIKGFLRDGIFIGPVKFYDGNDALKEIGKMEDDDFEDEFCGVYNNNGKMNFRGGKKCGSREGFGVEYYSNGQISYVGEFENDFYKMQQSRLAAILDKRG